MRLNLPSKVNGRRSGLAWNAAEAVVRRWIDDAVELLSSMPYTCALDFVDDHGWYETQRTRVVGKVLGVSRQRILVEVAVAQQHGRAEGLRRGIDMQDEEM